jgi:transporter family-2 protein
MGTKTLLLMAIAMFAAGVIPLQAAINGKLGEILKQPFLAAFVSFVGGTIFLAVIVLVTSRGVPTWPAGAGIPWYLFTGGLLGAVFVTMTLVLVPKIGTANVLAAAIVGQLILGVLIDHFGWLHVDPRPINLPRIIGCVVLLVGILLIQWPQSKPAIESDESSTTETIDESLF